MNAFASINTSAMLIVRTTLSEGACDTAEGRMIMKSIPVAVATCLVMFAAAAHAADDTETLIALDKQWGESTLKGDKSVSEKLLGDKVVSVDENGVMGKPGMLAGIKPAPAAAHYEPTDYKVTFMNPDTAIMTHGTKGADAHFSLHVWSRKGGTWQIVATSQANAKSGK
jgi:uncharacterized protein DUF4440